MSSAPTLLGLDVTRDWGPQLPPVLGPTIDRHAIRHAYAVAAARPAG